MKKLLIVLLALILLFGGLFLWKGGHHAVFLADQLEEWADQDAADLFLTVSVSRPTVTVREGADTFAPEVDQLSLTSNAFWTEYGDDRVYGLTAGGYTAYLLDDILYMDTGNAYALPRFDGLEGSLRELAAGLILHGRVTRDGNVYRLDMEREELTLRASVTLDPEVRSISVQLQFPYEGTPLSLQAIAYPKAVSAHPIPAAVTDAIVHAAMEPPMALTEPLELLIPALSDLMPLQADVTLGVECGILTLSETVGLSFDGDSASLTRNGETVPLTLPEGLEKADPAVLALALLRSGSFSRSGDAAEFRVPIPAEQLSAPAFELLPQLEALGIDFQDGVLVLRIQGEKLVRMDLSASGQVPFLLTTIPLRFTAEFHIHIN